MGQSWLRLTFRGCVPGLLMLFSCRTDKPTVETDAGVDAGATAQAVCGVGREVPCGDGTCVAASRFCDGVFDCASERDEADCEDTNCESGRVGCGNGECIALNEVCDGTPHCGDGSDEQGCPEPLCEGLPSGVGGYQGPRVYTREQYAECAALCAGSEDCYSDANCPGISRFEACVYQESVACSAGFGGGCRIDYESLACCSIEQCANDDACTRRSCKLEAAVLKVCLDRDRGCSSTATDLCFAGAEADSAL